MTAHPDEPHLCDNLGTTIASELGEAGFDLAAMHILCFIFGSESETSIQGVVAELEPAGFACVVEQQDELWFCLATRSLPIDVEMLNNLGHVFRKLAEAKGAEVDGWERHPSLEEQLASGGTPSFGIISQDVDTERYPHAVTLRIADSVQPIDRGTRYEDPLGEALAEHALGEVTGGGTQLTTKGEIDFVRLHLQLANLDHAVTLVRRTMEELGTPVGSAIEFEEEAERAPIPFGTQQALTVYIDGRTLPASSYEGTDMGDLSDMFDAALDAGSLGIRRDDDWMGRDEGAIYMYGPDAERMFTAIEPALLSYPLGENARVVIRTGVKGSAERELRIPRRS